MLLSYLYIGIKADAAGICIPESDIIVSLVLEQSRTGQGPLIPLPDWFQHLFSFTFWHRTGGCRTVWHSSIYKSCTKLYTLLRKDIHTGGRKKTPCTSTLLVVERQPAHPQCSWWNDHLQVHIAGSGETRWVGNLILAIGRGIDSRTLVWNWVAKLHNRQAGATTLCLLGSQPP
jgi:hypothetical protein